MKNFWPIINGTIVFVFVGFILLPRPTSYDWEPPLWAELAFFSLAGILVAIVWAVIFRKQLERGQVKLTSLFLLVAFEAAWFAAFKYFNPRG